MKRIVSDPDDPDPVFNRFDYTELGFPFTPDAPTKPNVIDINTARRKRDEQEDRRLEKLVIERWSGPTNERDEE